MLAIVTSLWGACTQGERSCYTVFIIVISRQGLKSFAGMCTRQEDFHRSMARELLHHLSSRGGKAHLADIAEPGPSCSTASCAEAVRVSLRLEEWLLENFSTTQQVATQVSQEGF